MLKYFLIVGVVCAAFFTGWQLGSSSAYQEGEAKMQTLRAELALAAQEHAAEVLDIERSYQNEVAKLDEKIHSQRQEDAKRIADLSALISNYRVREQVRSEADVAVPKVAAAPCKCVNADKDRWLRSFTELSKLSLELAAERDDLARQKNELVKFYEGVRSGQETEFKGH